MQESRRGAEAWHCEGPGEAIGEVAASVTVEIPRYQRHEDCGMTIKDAAAVERSCPEPGDKYMNCGWSSWRGRTTELSGVPDFRNKAVYTVGCFALV